MGDRSGLVSSQGRVRPDLVIRELWGVERDRSILGFGESQLFEAPISLFSTAPVCTDFYCTFYSQVSDLSQPSARRYQLAPTPWFIHTIYPSTPHFQLDRLESLLSSRFISLDMEGFVRIVTIKA